MAMSLFYVEPRIGYMDCLKRIYGYLYKYKYSTIWFRIEEPNLSDLSNLVNSYKEAVYGKVKKVLPTNILESQEKHIITVSYYNTNSYYNAITRCSVTSTLYFMNKTSIEWYSKKQTTIEIATYRSEYSYAYMFIK